MGFAIDAGIAAGLATPADPAAIARFLRRRGRVFCRRAYGFLPLSWLWRLCHGRDGGMLEEGLRRGFCGGGRDPCVHRSRVVDERIGRATRTEDVGGEREHGNADDRQRDEERPLANRSAPRFVARRSCVLDTGAVVEVQGNASRGRLLVVTLVVSRTLGVDGGPGRRARVGRVSLGVFVFGGFHRHGSRVGNSAWAHAGRLKSPTRSRTLRPIPAGLHPHRSRVAYAAATLSARVDSKMP